MGNHRTLEWACAAARLTGKGRRRPREHEDREGDETEEDDVEAVTPEGSLGPLNASMTRTRPRLPPPAFMPVVVPEGGAKDVPQDDDMMRAALALCGLGRRSG